MPSPAINPWNTDKPWDRSSSWVGCVPYTRIVNQRVTGNPDQWWLEYAYGKYLRDLPADGRVLVVGASEGGVSRQLRKLGYGGTIVASDIADKALERARAKDLRLGISGIEYLVADLNKDIIPGPFDAIIAEGVLHHIRNIDDCLVNLRGALRPGGMFVAMEYVGAFRFQFPPAQVAWINAALAMVPRKYRPMPESYGRQDLPPSAEDLACVYYVKPSSRAVEQADPSEALTGMILPGIFERLFEVVEKKPAGGSLVMNMTGHFPFDLANKDADCATWLRLIADLEMTLIEQGIVPSDLVFYALRRA